MSHRSWFVLLAAVVLGSGALALVPAVATADDAACGSKDNPCPLQKWMRANMGPASANGDLPALAKALDSAGGFSPDSTWTWAKISKDGADAARKGDLATAKAACKTCHDAYKDKYKSQFRTKAVP
jgi:hypothetical protein